MEFKFLYRDTNLPQNFIEQYKPSTDIVEQGFTDTSKLRGGPNGNVRYLILSSQGKDLGTVDENAKQRGLIVFSHSTVKLPFLRTPCLDVCLLTAEP